MQLFYLYYSSIVYNLIFVLKKCMHFYVDYNLCCICFFVMLFITFKKYFLQK